MTSKPPCGRDKDYHVLSSVESAHVGNNMAKCLVIGIHLYMESLMHKEKFIKLANQKWWEISEFKERWMVSSVDSTQIIAIKFDYYAMWATWLNASRYYVSTWWSPSCIRKSSSNESTNPPDEWIREKEDYVLSSVDKVDDIFCRHLSTSFLGAHMWMTPSCIKGPYADHILIPRAQPEVVHFFICDPLSQNEHEVAKAAIQNYYWFKFFTIQALKWCMICGYSSLFCSSKKSLLCVDFPFFFLLFCDMFLKQAVRSFCHSRSHIKWKPIFF